MSGGNKDIRPIAAVATDLRALQYRAVLIGGTLVAGTPNILAYGIVQNKPNSGEPGSALVHGPSKFQAGGTITAGARLKVASGGFMLAAASGDAILGRSHFAVASGALSAGDGGDFDFRTLGYHNGT